MAAGSTTTTRPSLQKAPADLRRRVLIRTSTSGCPGVDVTPSSVTEPGLTTAASSVLIGVAVPTELARAGEGRAGGIGDCRRGFAPVGPDIGAGTSRGSIGCIEAGKDRAALS